MNAKEFAKEWIASWNSHDLESIISHYDKDIEFNSPVVKELMGIESGTIEGISTLKSYFGAGLQKYPDLVFELIHVLQGVNNVVLLYKNPIGGVTSEAFEFNAKGLVAKVVASYG